MRQVDQDVCQMGVSENIGPLTQVSASVQADHFGPRCDFDNPNVFDFSRDWARLDPAYADPWANSFIQ